MTATSKPAAGAALGGCVAALGVPFLSAWLLMLALGALHSVVAAVPPVGYWTVFAVLFGLNVLVAVIRRAGR